LTTVILNGGRLPARHHRPCSSLTTDYAIGRVAEIVARIPYADSTLIFIIEDDAQDGPDHMDAHRSVAHVIGPNVKQKKVSPRATPPST
jgi:hypothetical protein